MGINDFEANFNLIRESQKISCQRKKELFITFLREIDEVFLKNPEDISSLELKHAEIVYCQIENYLNH